MKNKFASRFFSKSISPLLALGALTNVAYSQTTRTWDGGGVAGTNMDTPANWSGDAVPNGVTSDTAQWDGTVSGDLSLTYTAAGTGAPLAGAPGVFLSVLGTQTSPLTINETSGTAGLRCQNLTIASGAGAFTLGSSDATNDIITLGNSAVNAFTWTNNSTAAATLGTDARFGFGGGVAKTMTFAGSGNWLFGAKFGVNGTGSLTSISKTGAGRLTFNGNIVGTNSAGNPAPGNIFVKAGSVEVDTNGVVTTINFNSVGQSGTDAGTMTLKGSGSFVSGGDFNAGDIGSSTGILNVQDTASLSVGVGGGFFIGSANAAGSTASGIVNHSAGTVTVNRTNDGAFVLGGRNAAAGAGGSGTYNLSADGVLTNAGNAFIGGYGTGKVVQTGGIFNNSGFVSIARQTGSTGTYTISGGLLNQTGVTAGIIVGELGMATLTVSDSGAMTTTDTGFLRIGNGVTGNGTVNLDGGIITTSKVDTVLGTSIFNFNGGKLQANAVNPIFFQGLTTANIRDGGALIDTNGFNITIGQPLGHSAIDGDAAIDGGFTKIGEGDLMLTGASNYNGPTGISTGALVFGGSSTTRSISVANGATLGGKVATTNASVVSATNNPSLTLGTSGATNLSLDFSTLGNPTVPVFNLGSGVATLNGVVSVSLANVTALTTTPNNTTLKLVSYGSKVGAGSWSLATPTAGHTIFALNPTATALYLSVSANPVTWTGAASNAWNDNTLGAPKNWKLPSNAQTDFINGDTVTFTNTATSFNPDITEDITVGSVTFSNTSNAYTIASTNGFGITGGLINLNGSGTVTINNANTYAGGTTLNAGKLVVNDPSAIGTGTLTVAGGNLDSTFATTLSTNNVQFWNADFSFGGTSDLDMGTGPVTLGGAGDRIVTVAGTFTVGEIKSDAAQGLTKQGAGTLAVSSDGSGIAASVVNGVLNVAGGTLQINRSSGVTGDFLAAGIIGTGNITNGSGLERWVFSNAATGDFTFSGALSNGASGGLGFNKSGGSSQTLSGNNNYSGVTTVAGGMLILTGANTISGATNVTGGTLSITGTNSAGGAVSVNGTAANPAILNLQNSNALGTSVVTSINRNSGIQLQGNITLPSTVTYITSNDGTTGATVPYVFGNLSGDNTINGSISLVDGGGGTIIQSDSGSLTLTGNITIAATKSSRGIILQGASTGANTFSGVLSDLSGTSVASIAKNGTGTWTVSGANTYTGATTVNAGTLIVSGSLAASAVTVAANATLAGNGNLGGSVTINAAGHQALAVAANPGAQVKRTIVGVLNLTAIGDIIDLTAASAPATGSYILVTANGGITGQTGGVLDDTVVNLTGLSGTVSVVGNDLVLTVGGASAYDTWAASKGLHGDPDANNGPTQDPEFDGISNLLEFVLDGNPLASDTGKLPKSSQDATNFYFDFDRKDDSVAEVALTFESGTTLAAWPSSVVIPASNTPIAGPPVTITDNGGGTHHVTVTVEKAGNTLLFGRLKAVK